MPWSEPRSVYIIEGLGLLRCIVRVTVRIDQDGMAERLPPRPGFCNYFHPSAYHDTFDEAHASAIKARDLEIQGIKRQLSELKKKTFERPPGD